MLAHRAESRHIPGADGARVSDAIVQDVFRSVQRVDNMCMTGHHVIAF